MICNLSSKRKRIFTREVARSIYLS